MGVIMEKMSFPLQQIIRWDMELCVACNKQTRNLLVRNIFRLASRLGDGMFWYALMGILLLRYGMDALHAVIHMMLVAAAGTLLYKSIKSWARRPRPFQVYPDIVCAGTTLDKFSFPSGHTMHAVAFSTIAVSYYPSLVWVVLPFSAMVALSRPILGLHYPSDVLAGALIGAGLAACSMYG